MAVSALELQTRHYWRTMSDGLARSTLTEFHDEMEVLALRADTPRLRDIVLRDIVRYDGSFTLVRAARAK